MPRHRKFSPTASRYIARANASTVIARRKACDHDFTLQDEGRHAGAYVCDKCGKVMPMKGSPT